MKNFIKELGFQFDEKNNRYFHPDTKYKVLNWELVIYYFKQINMISVDVNYGDYAANESLFEGVVYKKEELEWVLTHVRVIL